MEQETLVPEELPPLLVDLLGPYLARQRWCGVEGLPGPVRTIESGCLAELGSPSRRLLWAIVEVQGSDYQVVIAERPIEELAEHLKGHEDALIGNVGESAYYDATIDTEMALALLRAASGGLQSAERSRPLAAEQSNTSLVYDDRLILKFFRRLTVGPTPMSKSLQPWQVPGSPISHCLWCAGSETGVTSPSASSTSPGGPMVGLSRSLRYAISTGLQTPGQTPTRPYRGATSPRKRTASAR